MRPCLDVAQIGNGLAQTEFRKHGAHGPDADQASRVLIRQRTQQHRIDDAEDGGGSAYAQRESEHGDRGEAGRFAQAAHSVAYVLGHALKKRAPPLPAAVFTQTGHVAELPLSRVAGLFGVHAAGQVLRRLPFGVQSHFFREFLVKLAAAQQKDESAPGFSDERHRDSPYVVRMTRAMAAMVRWKLSASTPSCFLPAGVRV